MRWVVALLIVGLFVAAGVVFNARRERNRVRNAVFEQWERFEKAALTADEDGLREAAEGVLAIEPKNDRALRYKAALESGEAAESDTALCFLTTLVHWKKNDLPAASREAKKRLVHAPTDWIARCIVVQAALVAGDQNEVSEHLALMPDPQKNPPNPVGLLLAYHLFQRTGQDTTPFRRLVNNAVVDMLGSVVVEKYGPAAKAQLVECYLIGFDRTPDKPQENRMSLGLTPATRLLDQAIQEGVEKNDVAGLTRVGAVCNSMAEPLALLLRSKQITAEQHTALAREHDARTGKVWQAVLDRDPASPAAHQSLALWHARNNRLDKAREVVVAGLKASGDHPQLLALYTNLLVTDGRADEATKLLFEAAQREPTNVVLWTIAAETALTANRRDLALDACRKARDLSPGNPYALRTEATILLSVNDAHGAVQLLRQLGEPALLAEPRLAAGYVSSLIAAGLDLHVPDFLTRSEAAALKAGTPRSVVGGLLGVAMAPHRPDLFKLATETVDRLIERWKTDRDLLTVRASLYRKAAEEAEPRWETDRVRTAEAALDRVRAFDDKDPNVAAELAWVRVKGANKPAAALDAADPLHTAFSRNEPLSPAHLKVLGVVYLANGKPADAVKALEQARRAGTPSASVSIHLALAYHAAGRVEDARQMLADARTRPMSPQDATDFATAQATLLREKP
jgi:predicted Zn-dependent protease